MPESLDKLGFFLVVMMILPYDSKAGLRTSTDCAQRLGVGSIAVVADFRALVSPGPAKTSKAEAQLVGSFATLLNGHVLDALERVVRQLGAKSAVHDLKRRCRRAKNDTSRQYNRDKISQSEQFSQSWLEGSYEESNFVVSWPI